MRTYIATGLIVLLLTACTSPVTSLSGTLRQKYFTVKQDYSVVLTVVDQYIKACRTTPTSTCLDLSAKAQQADLKIDTLFKSADSALLADDEERAATYLFLISVALEELRTLVAAKVAAGNP